MEQIYIAGVSMTLFDPRPDETVKKLTQESVQACLPDAEASAAAIQHA